MFTLKQGGIPLTLLESSQLTDWLAEQPNVQQQWMRQTGFTEKAGLCLIPNELGELQRAVFVCDSLSDYFACGELANLLPAGRYQIDNITDHNQLIAIAFAWGSGAYRFDRYKKSKAAQATLDLNNAEVIEQATHLIRATQLVRDLINTPASDMMPEQLAQATRELAHEHHAHVKEIIGDDLLRNNYPMIHAVGRASRNAPCLIDLTWGKEQHPQITLVGKGVCFDSGGLNLKPGEAMRHMKKDMGGAAQVLGLAHLIMANQLPIRLRVIIAAVENAVSGDAFRPGDVLPTRKGLTVEIDNTDAEGRLVLCDALTEAVSQQPELIIDFATLTGACRVALGTELPGFFTNQPTLAAELMQFGERVSDPVWPLPLHQPYNDMLKSDVADLVNSVPSPFGGAITAALYLQHFVEQTPWVHFDVMAWNRRKLPGRPIGGEAMGIRAVFEYLRQRYSA